MQKFIKFVFVLFFLLAFIACKQEQTESQEVAKSKEIERPDQGVSKKDTVKPKAVAVQTEETNSPSIKFETLEYDFGEIDAGDKVEHIFSFGNVGTAVLNIEKVRSS